MNVNRFLCTLFTASICGLSLGSAQQSLTAPTAAAAAVPADSHAIRFNVVVDTKSGQPVPNLHQQDFSLLDNKAPRPIASFRVLSPAEVPVHVILVVDAVNTPFHMVAYIRDGIESYLKAREGALAQPTSIAVLTDAGIQVENDYSTNGLELSDLLEKQHIGLREINRSSQWGDYERFQICMTAVDHLINYTATVPGRKIVLWISPGWPLISGARTELSQKQEQQLFSTVVSFSTRLRDADVTLYNINPVGVAESLERADYYQTFLRGIAKPYDVMPGNLGVQVLAVQSGGLTIESNSDIPGMIRRCLADVGSWYEIAFDPQPSEKPNEYHHVAIKLDQRDLTARTRDGYYSNPTFLGQ